MSSGQEPSKPPSNHRESNKRSSLRNLTTPSPEDSRASTPLPEPSVSSLVREYNHPFREDSSTERKAPSAASGALSDSRGSDTEMTAVTASESDHKALTQSDSMPSLGTAASSLSALSIGSSSLSIASSASAQTALGSTSSLNVPQSIAPKDPAGNGQVLSRVRSAFRRVGTKVLSVMRFRGPKRFKAMTTSSPMNMFGPSNDSPITAQSHFVSQINENPPVNAPKQSEWVNSDTPPNVPPSLSTAVVANTPAPVMAAVPSELLTSRRMNTASDIIARCDPNGNGTSVNISPISSDGDASDHSSVGGAQMDVSKLASVRRDP